jgi:hypothetical protein
MKLSDIAYTELLGTPVVYIFGGIALALMVLAGLIAYLNTKGNHTIPFKYHPKVAFAAYLFVLVHVVLALAFKFGI